MESISDVVDEVIQNCPIDVRRSLYKVGAAGVRAPQNRPLALISRLSCFPPVLQDLLKASVMATFFLGVGILRCLEE